MPAATLTPVKKKPYRVQILSKPEVKPGDPAYFERSTAPERGRNGRSFQKPLFPLGVTDHAGVTFHSHVYRTGSDGMPSEKQAGQVIDLSDETYQGVVKALQVGELPDAEWKRITDEAAEFEKKNALPVGARFVSRSFGWVIQWEKVLVSEGRKPDEDVFEWRSQKVWRGSRLYVPTDDPLNEVPLARYLVCEEVRPEYAPHSVPVDTLGVIPDRESPDEGSLDPGPELTSKGIRNKPKKDDASASRS